MQFSAEQPITILVTCPFGESEAADLRSLGYRLRDAEVGMSAGDGGFHAETWPEFTNDKASIFIAESPADAAVKAARSFPDVVLFSADSKGAEMRNAIRASDFLFGMSVASHQSLVDVIAEMARSTPAERRQSLKTSSYSLAVLAN